MVVTVTESEVIRGVWVVEPRTVGDARGRFVESYRRSWFPAAREMVQANRSDKVAGTVVGLHYHLHQADYWYFTRGRALVVLHDLREGSPTWGVSLTLEMGDEDGRGLFIPPGVAHGYAALTDLTMTYLVDQYFNPDDELGLAWDDPVLKVEWPVGDPILSDRDRENPLRVDIPAGRRPYLGLRT